MAVSTDVQEGPCDLELSLDAPSLMPFPSSPGKDHGFFFFYVLTHIQHPHLDPPAGQDGPFTGSTSLWPLACPPLASCGHTQVISALFLKPRTKPQLIHCRKMNVRKKGFTEGAEGF